MRRASRLSVAALLAVAGCGSSSSSSSSSTDGLTLSPADGSTLPTGTIGQTYSETFTIVSGGTAPFKLIPTGTPAGLTFTSPSSSEGVLSGTPTQSGQGTFEIQVIDGTGAVTDVSYTLTIDSTPSGTLTLTPTTLPNGTQGTTYSQQFTVTGGNAPYAFTVTSGTLPPGLTLGAYGTTTAIDDLTGAPTVQGTYSFTIEVSDGSTPANTASQSYTITIS